MTDGQTEPLKSASDLWQAIVRSAGLDIDRYDEPLIKELASNLGIPSHDFERQLSSAGITAETLLLQVFRSISPYAAMMKDVLKLFARAVAQASADNLRIRFDFDSVTDSFEFDLSNFRDWENLFSEVVANLPADEIDELQALQIRHAFLAEGVTYQISGSKWSHLNPSEAEVGWWLSEMPGIPPSEVPPPPKVFDAELAKHLARVWRLLKTSILSTATGEGLEVLSLDDVRMIVRGAYILKADEALLLRKLREAFKDIQTVEIETTVLLEQLLAVFNLPIWKRRSELYSVWVGAQLITALGYRVRIHSVDRTIVFSFSGAHLATVSLFPEENFHVWCELRTKAAGLIGKGRKRAIQPDYVVLREPISHLNSAILVVECKQYLQQSRKNFANALVDYARTHQKALIALVNYGPTTSSILELVKELDPSILNRTRVIGTFRPGSQVAVSEFQELVESLIPKVEPPASEVPENELSLPGFDASPEDHAGGLRLSWQNDVDLDVHCWITDEQGNCQHVSFAQKVGHLGASKIELNQDLRTGGGVERLEWEKVQSVQLDVAVHAYSQDTDFSLAMSRVEVNAWGHTLMLEPPKGQRGRWWTLFRLVRQTSAIQIWNSISDHGPGF